MKLKVCIVDDDKMVVFIHRQIMNKTHFFMDPMAFENGQLMLDYIRENDQDDTVLLILLDINMPVMNGWEFLDAINQLPVKQTLHVAMVTSSIDIVDKLKANTYPQVFTFIEKPIRAAALDFIRAHDLLKCYFN